MPRNPKSRGPLPRGIGARLLGWKFCSPRKTLPLTRLRLTSLLLRARWSVGIGAQRRMRSEPRVRTESFTLALFIFGLVFLTLVFLFCFSTELEKKMAEAASAVDALQKSLDAEVADRSTLEAVVALACEGLRVSAGESGSSL